MAPAPASGPHEARMRQLELRVWRLECALEAACVMGAGAAALAFVAARRPHHATFSSISTRSIRVADNLDGIAAGRAPHIELSATQTAARVEVLDGSISLRRAAPSAEGSATPAIHMDAAYAPPPPQARDGAALGSGQAWAVDRHGVTAAVAAHRGAPAISFHGRDGEPRAIVDADGHDSLRSRPPLGAEDAE